MKNLGMLITLLTVLITFTACEKEEMLSTNETVLTVAENENARTDTDMNSYKITTDETLIVLSAPSVYNNYYAAAFDDIIDYLINFANLIENKDKVVILADAETMPYLEGQVPQNALLEAYIEDIWIRDFGATIPSKQVKFNYLPDFQGAGTSNLIDNSFEDWFYDSGLQFHKKSNLILDGGNVVDNGSNRVIVTDRFLWDNPQLTKNMAKNKLKNLMGVSQVAIIPELPGDATGHADGMVMFTGPNKILLHEMPAAIQQKTIKELKKSFPGVEVAVVPDYYEDETWQGFSSACNIFVNSLVTDKYIYMPTFDSPYDNQMFDFISSHTNKTVIPVPAEGVCYMGGSVRCLSWQVKGQNANKILNLAK